MDGVRRRTFALLAFAFLLVPHGSADELADTRAELGARMFRAFLSADVDLEKKTIDNHVLVVFLCGDDRRRAADLASKFLGQSKDIHGIPIAIEYSTDASLAAYHARVPAGVFVAQPLPQSALRVLIRYGIEHHVIVYSPFEGDVERGILGGISVEAQVRPYVNASTLAASNVSLKSLFFKVTKVFR